MAAGIRAGWAWVALAVVGADQAAKLALKYLTDETWERTLIPGLLNLVHRYNPGVAFGLFADASSPWVGLLLIAFTVVAVTALVWVLATRRAGGRLSQLGLALVLGGATGNGIDRFAHGSVIDFVDMHLGSYHWPAYNVADAAIVVGAGLVIVELFAERRRPQAGKA